MTVMVSDPRSSVQYEKRRRRTEQRNSAMLERFLHLYEKKRLRMDDCIAEVATEFFLSTSYTERIIQRSLNTQ